MINVKTRGDNSNVDANGEGVPNRYYLEAIHNVKFISVPIPTGLNSKDKGMNLHIDGIRVDYISSSTLPDEPCIVRANHFIPPACGVFYFEILIKAAISTPIAVGLCTKGADKDGYLPGQQRHSTQQSTSGIPVIYTYGYESQKGDRLGGSNEGDRYGPPWTTGDSIGCCIDYTNDCIHFTRNGTSLGVAFQGCGFGEGYRGNLYPCVGLSQRGQSIEVNFGSRPFLYDLAGFVNECRTAARSDVLVQAASPLPYRKLMDHLVLDFLRVYGYSDTADKFAHDIGQTNTSNEDQDTPARKDLFHYIASGNLQQAIQHLDDFYPTLLEQRLDVLFQIKCQIFIEIIKRSLNNDQMEEGDEAKLPSVEAINFGRKELVPLSRQLSTFSEEEEGIDAQKNDAKREKQKQLIRDVFSLLAYQNPYSSPVSYLLEDERRNVLARKVNRAVLKHTMRRKDAAIETVVRQGQSIIELLVTHSQLPIASLLRVDDFM